MLRSPIFTQSLPSSTPGPHKNVGYSYIRTSPLHPHATPSPKLASAGEPALSIQQIGYSLFYPCEDALRRSSGIAWFPEPTREMMLGYEKFLGRKGVSWLIRGLRYVVGRLKILVHLNAPLKDVPDKFPLAIFSHGLAGTRHTYSQYVSALASKGYVVLVVEHRDGSGPAVTLPDDKVLHYVRKDDLSWADESDTSLERFRTLQLDMRIREMHEVFESFVGIVKGQMGSMDIMGLDKEEEKKAEWIKSFGDRVDTSEVTLTGHSFGGGTILYALQNPPPEPYAAFKVNKAIALDPWLEPLPKPAPSTDPPSPLPSILVVNSPGFTVWKGHFPRLVDMIRQANGTLVTLNESNHQSFSDFPLLAPSSPDKALLLLSRTYEMSSALLDGKMEDCELLRGEPDGGNLSLSEEGKLASTDPTVVHLRRTS